MAKFKVKLKGTGGYVELDDVDISNCVSSLSISVAVGEITRVTLCCPVTDIELQSDDVQVILNKYSLRDGDGA